ncbi:hypothetical protein HPB49_026221 [Dermacentor silvarum]|nr:hypothetical protein HPB49_026221 [Dermacentor silvarum]
MSGGGGCVLHGKMGQAVLDDNMSAEQMEQLTSQLTALENKARDLHERCSVLEDKINSLRKDVTASKHACRSSKWKLRNLSKAESKAASLETELEDAKKRLEAAKLKYSELEKVGKELLTVSEMAGKFAENALSSKQIELTNQLEQSEAAFQDRQAKVTRWTREEKLEIIRTIENGAKKSAVAREKNLPLTTVCGIWNAREKLWGGSGSNLKRCRIRDSAFPEVEKALLLWLKKARSMNLPATTTRTVKTPRDCENLLVEVLERQGAADEEVNFGTFRDVDGDVTTSPDF